MVVDDDVGGLQTALAAHADERRITGAGADDVDTRSVHGHLHLQSSTLASALVQRVAAPSASSARRADRAELRIRGGRAPIAATDSRPVERRDDRRASRAFAILSTAMAPSGSWQPPPSAATTRAFGRERSPAARIVNRRERRPRLFVVGADLNGNDTLTGGRNALVDWDRRRDAIAEAEPAQAGAGEHQRVELAGVELAQTRVDIAANRRERRARERAARAAPMRRTLPVPIDRAAVEPRGDIRHSGDLWRGIDREARRVARIFARQARGDRQAVRQIDRHVLRAVHGEVDVAAQQRVFDLLHELTLGVVARRPAPLPAIDRRSS